jgi:hypothetical protein
MFRETCMKKRRKGENVLVLQFIRSEINQTWYIIEFKFTLKRTVANRVITSVSIEKVSL